MRVTLRFLQAIVCQIVSAVNMRLQVPRSGEVGLVHSANLARPCRVNLPIFAR